MFPSNFVTQQMDTPAPVEQPVAKEPVKITQVHIRSIFHELSIIPKSKDLQRKIETWVLFAMRAYLFPNGR